MSHARPSSVVLVSSVALLCLVWGSTWIVIQQGLEDLPPFTSAGVRFAIAALGMSVVARRLAAREGGTSPPRHLVLAMGGLNFGVSYGIVYWVETRVPSALTAVLWAVYPILLALVSHWLLPGERLRGRQWAGLLLAFAGIAVLFSGDLAALGPEVVTAGAVLLVSPFVSAVGTALVKRDGAGVSSLRLNGDGMLLGASLLCALALLTERSATPVWSARALASLAYLSLCGTVLTFGLYYWVMRYVPAYRLALIAYVTPVIAISLGVGLGDEPVTRSTLLGGALVLAGVGAVLRRGG